MIFEVLNPRGQLGNDPFSRFFDRSRNTNGRSWRREQGIVPEKELLKRRSPSSIGATISDGSAPDRLFPERSKKLRFVGSVGIVPTIWLELASSISKGDNRGNVGSVPTSRFLDKFKYLADELAIQTGTLSCMLVFETSR